MNLSESPPHRDLRCVPYYECAALRISQKMMCFRSILPNLAGNGGGFVLQA